MSQLEKFNCRQNQAIIMKKLIDWLGLEVSNIFGNVNDNKEGDMNGSKISRTDENSCIQEARSESQTVSKAVTPSDPRINVQSTHEMVIHQHWQAEQCQLESLDVISNVPQVSDITDMAQKIVGDTDNPDNPVTKITSNSIDEDCQVDIDQKEEDLLEQTKIENPLYNLPKPACLMLQQRYGHLDAKPGFGLFSNGQVSFR